MPISQNETLFTIIGTTYGGDGQETFDLPNLCGRAPVHQGTGTGQNYQMGEAAGVVAEQRLDSRVGIENSAVFEDDNRLERGFEQVAETCFAFGKHSSLLLDFEQEVKRVEEDRGEIEMLIRQSRGETETLSRRACSAKRLRMLTRVR